MIEYAYHPKVGKIALGDRVKAQGKMGVIQRIELSASNSAVVIMDMDAGGRRKFPIREITK